jgi:hypothetical protein
MKRNLSLLRDLLLAVEDLPAGASLSNLNVGAHATLGLRTVAELEHHVQRLLEDFDVDGSAAQGEGGVALTWSIRSPKLDSGAFPRAPERPRPGP